MRRVPAEHAASVSTGRSAQPEVEEQAALPAKAETPTHWLERIARLRADGKDEEADRQLAELRRRYPDYRIPEEMRAKVLRAR